MWEGYIETYGDIQLCFNNKGKITHCIRRGVHIDKEDYDREIQELVYAKEHAISLKERFDNA